MKRAQKEGPQNITVHGVPVAVVLSREEYSRLNRPKPGFLEFLRDSPLVGVRIDFTRR